MLINNAMKMLMYENSFNNFPFFLFNSKSSENNLNAKKIKGIRFMIKIIIIANLNNPIK